MFIIPTEKRINWQRPPIAVFSLLLINILVFWLYQGLDNHRIEIAVTTYNDLKLLDEELPAYQQYLADNDKPAVNKNDNYLVYYIISDPGFTAYLNNNSKTAVVTKSHQRWLEKRTKVNEFWNKISSEAYGLKSNEIKPFTLLSYQFLHGDIFHLLGNMVFLLLIGFAVEAALGSIRFTFYYLIAGVGSGLFFSLIQSQSAINSFTSLVGASGSISGVLAMYLALFRLKKIEFFYWVLIFTGYFRFTALIILPIYILKELYFYYSNTGSNIAYTAHIGGFICGAILILLTHQFSKTSIDTDYLNNTEKPKDEYLIALNELYKKIGKCDFKNAWKALSEMINKHGINSELIEIKLNLVRALDMNKVGQFLASNVGKSQNNPRVINAQLNYWNKISSEQKSEFSFFQKHAFVIDLLEINQLQTAEKIYSDLKNTVKNQNEEIAVLARKIAIHYQSINKPDAANSYNNQAKELMQLTFS